MANKGPSLCGGEGRDEEEQVMKTVEKEVGKMSKKSDLLTLMDLGQ